MELNLYGVLRIFLLGIGVVAIRFLGSIGHALARKESRPHLSHETRVLGEALVKNIFIRPVRLGKNEHLVKCSRARLSSLNTSSRKA